MTEAQKKKIVISRIPKVYEINKPIEIDDTTYAKNRIIIPPDSGNVAANLNGTSITFTFSGETKWYSLSDPNSGFWTTIGYRTKLNNVNESTANITLANMWWGHMFSEATIRFGQHTIETVKNLGVVMETLAHLKGR